MATAASTFDQNAYSGMLNVLNSYGLGALAPVLKDLLIKYGPDQADIINLEIQETDQWKKRFAGNEVRRKAGLPVLSPSEYLATESAYRQVMQQFGLPKGFYDSPDDFAGFIGDDKSPQEISTRAQAASSAARNTDQNYRKFLSEQYGVKLTDGDITAYFLDKQRALPVIQRTLDATAIGAAAGAQGYGINRQRAEFLSDRGVSADQARSGYANVNQVLRDTQKLGSIYGDTYGLEDAESEFLLQDAGAQRKRMKLGQRETDTFSGKSAVGASSLSRGSGSY